MENKHHHEDSHHEIPTYVEHEGTLKISGSTLPKKAGSCAFHYLQQQKKQIDFFCIGANANQQAMKSMGVFFYLVEKDSNNTITVAFQPLRFKTRTTDPDTREERDRDCVVWRTRLITKETENEPQGRDSTRSSRRD